MSLLEIRDLTVSFTTRAGSFHAVDGLDLAVDPGEILGIVGESGSGKSVAMLAVMGLLAPTATARATRLAFAGRELLDLSPGERRALAGKAMAMVFQEPMTSLNPCFTVGFQIIEALRTHEGGSTRILRQRTVELLARVGIPEPAQRLSAYPHQFSGGMSQRVMIAMAIACRPQLLIADEPTTALDVTIQRQILDLLVGLARESRMALVLITHNMGVVAETADRVCVMYAGQAMERRGADALFARPRHPYTGALLSALPERTGPRQRLAVIPGVVPGLADRPLGCLFHPRCAYAVAHCRAERPALAADGDGATRCHFPLGGSA